MTVRELVEVTEALGPGFDVERGEGGALVVVRARRPGGFPGVDRAAVVDSDDGTGRALRALVALPVSSWRGCRVEVRWEGVVRDARGAVLLGGIEGGPRVTPQAVRAALDAALGDTGTPETAARIALEARRRFRERRVARRVTGGSAWEAPVASPEAMRFATAHSRSSYALTRLPPRYIRALERLLDPDERVLYAVERPFGSLGGTWRRAGGPDRRAALLALTDRQVVWVVDHADPDRFLMDWGVDAACVPVERMTRVSAEASGGRASVRVETGAGTSDHRLPAELAEEAGLFAELAARFTPSVGSALPRRTYPEPDEAIEWGRMDAFGEAAAVRALAIEATGRPLAVVPSPARPGHRRTTAWVLDGEGIILAGAAGPRRVALGSIHGLGLVLSPLEARTEILGRHPARLDVPAPYLDVAAAFTRAARRRLASVADAPGS